jgi:hypothetical protein
MASLPTELQQMEVNYLLAWDELENPEIDLCSPPTVKGNTSDGKETNTSKKRANKNV